MFFAAVSGNLHQSEPHISSAFCLIFLMSRSYLFTSFSPRSLVSKRASMNADLYCRRRCWISNNERKELVGDPYKSSVSMQSSTFEFSLSTACKHLSASMSGQDLKHPTPFQITRLSSLRRRGLEVVLSRRASARILDYVKVAHIQETPNQGPKMREVPSKSHIFPLKSLLLSQKSPQDENRVG
jgi:hypothetical protein